MYIFDHKKRIKRLQESLKIAGTGTAVVVLPSNIRYLTGFWGYAARAEYFEPRRLICLVEFDWSEDYAVIGGERTKLQVAHIKLSHSRAFLVRAYLLQTHEMLFDAHWHGFRVFGGVPARGIYDNLWTPPGREEHLAALGIGCVNLSGLSLELSRSWP